MIYLTVVIVCILYLLALFTISPIIDHAFTPLDKEKSNVVIMGEIIAQILLTSVIWLVISEVIMNKVTRALNIKGNQFLTKFREVTAAVVLVGLQSHLIDKLKHVTYKHPFRILNLYGD